MNETGEVLVSTGFHCFKVSFICKIAVRFLSSYRWCLSLQFPLPTPYRFHLVVLWRGSSGLGKIRESMLAQFPPGLRTLQVPHRVWSASTKLRLCTFDLYSMTVTQMKKMFRMSRVVFGHASHISENNCQINGTHSPLCDSRRGIDFSF